MKLSPHHRAVWAVLKIRYNWTAQYLTERANLWLESRCRSGRPMTTATATARLRDFRKARYGGHTIVCKRLAGYDAPVYRLVK